MSAAIFAESKAKIGELNRLDKERIELEAARNRVESYCYLIKNKLVDEEELISKISTEEQREEIRQLASDTTDWLDFDAYDASLETMQAKYKAMADPAEKIWFRMKELTARPEAIAALTEKLGKVEDLLKKWETSMPQITEDERADVQSKVEDIKKWIQDKVEEQDSKASHEDPAFTSSEVPLQTKPIEKLVAKLSKKPKPKPEKKEEEKSDKAENETASEEESKADDSEETPATEEASEDSATNSEEDAEKKTDDEL